MRKFKIDWEAAQVDEVVAVLIHQNVLAVLILQLVIWILLLLLNLKQFLN